MRFMFTVRCSNYSKCLPPSTPYHLLPPPTPNILCLHPHLTIPCLKPHLTIPCPKPHLTIPCPKPHLTILCLHPHLTIPCLHPHLTILPSFNSRTDLSGDNAKVPCSAREDEGELTDVSKADRDDQRPPATGSNKQAEHSNGQEQLHSTQGRKYSHQKKR